ncbi:MAG: AIR synthase-related protein, partial [Cyanobacteria bacterium J06629_19]
GTVTLGGSEYLKRVHETVAGQPPKIDVELELAVQAACRYGIRQGWVRSAHDCAEGGVAIALAESCISGQKGATVILDIGSLRIDTVLFGEGGARILVSIPASVKADWEQYCADRIPNRYTCLGAVTGTDDPLVISTEVQQSVISTSVAAMKEKWGSAIEKALAVEL